MPDNKYSPLVHSHVFGVNEPWLRSNPRLWQKADLVNHPELIPFDGRLVVGSKAAKLEEMYSPPKLITEMIRHHGEDELGQIYRNEICRVRVIGPKELVTHSVEGLSAIEPEHEELNALFDSIELDSELIIELDFKYIDHSKYSVTKYQMMAAFGKDRLLAPTPRSWVYEASEEGDDIWETLDSQSGVDSWRIAEFNSYKIRPVSHYRTHRLRIIEWNPAEDRPDGLPSLCQSIGLCGFQVYGRQKDSFVTPRLVAPSSEFVWVVPIEDMGIGIHHEDIGDLGWSSISPDSPFWPKSRLLADGRSVLKSNEPKLFAVIGHTYDRWLDSDDCIFRISSGMVRGSQWFNETDDAGKWITVQTPEPVCLGKYSFNSRECRGPETWVVEAYDANTDLWIPIARQVGYAPEENPIAPQHFFTNTDQDVVSNLFRFTVQKWAAGTRRIGIDGILIYTHPPGEFHIPHMIESGRIGYVVRDNRLDDAADEFANHMHQLRSTVANYGTALSDIQKKMDVILNNIDVK